MGLLYNRTLFTQAGLDPNSPPTTWAEVQTDAKKIAALGNGTVGYADYSASNQGGWHFTAEIYSQGGTMVTADGKHATFDDAPGQGRADQPAADALDRQQHGQQATAHASPTCRP